MFGILKTGVGLPFWHMGSLDIVIQSYVKSCMKRKSILRSVRELRSQGRLLPPELERQIPRMTTHQSRDLGGKPALGAFSQHNTANFPPQQKTTRQTKRQKTQFEETEQARSKRDRDSGMAGILEWSYPELRKTTINILWALAEKVDNVQEQKGSMSTTIKILWKNKTRSARAQKRWGGNEECLSQAPVYTGQSWGKNLWARAYVNRNFQNYKAKKDWEKKGTLYEDYGTTIKGVTYT